MSFSTTSWNPSRKARRPRTSCIFWRSTTAVCWSGSRERSRADRRTKRRSRRSFTIYSRAKLASRNPTSGSSTSTKGRLLGALRQIERESRPASWTVCWIVYMEASEPLPFGHPANHAPRRTVVKSSEQRGSWVRTDSLVSRPRRFAHAPANGCSKPCKLSTCAGKRTSPSVSCAPLWCICSSASISARATTVTPISRRFPIGIAHFRRIRQDGKVKC